MKDAVVTSQNADFRSTLPIKSDTLFQETPEAIPLLYDNHSWDI